MKPLRIIIATSLILSISSCSDEDPIDTIQYHWPSWSFDDSFVIAKYDLNPQNKPDDAPITFSVQDIDDGVRRFISLPKQAGEEVRFWVSNRVDRMIVTGLGTRVIDLDGNIVNERVTVLDNLTPSLVSFSDLSQSYFWHVREEERSIIGIANNYSAGDLTSQTNVVLLDTIISQDVEEIAAASKGSCAALLSDGTILHISDQGVRILYESVIIDNPAVPTNRIQYLKPAIGSTVDYIYILDAEGLKRTNLQDASTDVILPTDEGNLLSFDIEPETRNILFVTSGNQVWLASENATPIQALLFEHTMASFNNKGTSVAAIGYVNGAQNEVTLLQYRQ